jgi:hypothetical protein
MPFVSIGHFVHLHKNGRFSPQLRTKTQAVSSAGKFKTLRNKWHLSAIQTF